MRLLKQSALAILEAFTLIIVTLFVVLDYLAMAIYTGFLVGMGLFDRVVGQERKK